MNSKLNRLLLAAVCLGIAMPTFACDVTIADSSNPDAINQAVATAVPGTVICVGPGTYNAVAIDSYTSETGITPRGEPNAWIVLRNLNKQRPKIVATTVNNRPQNGIAIGSDNVNNVPRYIEIRGFEIVSDYEQRTGSKITNYHASGINVWDYADHIRLIDNIVRGFPGSGIAVGGSDFIEIENNKIYNNAHWFRYQGSGISLGRLYTTDDADTSDFPESRDDVDFHNVIRGNTIHHNEVRVNGPSEWAWGDLTNPGVTDGNCILMEESITPILPDGSFGQYSGTTLIENNVCHDNGGNGIHFINSDNAWVVNNTLYHNGQTRLCPEGTRTPNGCAAVPFRELSVVRRGNGNYSWTNNLFFVNNLVVPDPATETYAVDATNNLLGTDNQPAAQFLNNIYTESTRFYGDAINQDYAEVWTDHQIRFKQRHRGLSFDIYNRFSVVTGKGATWMSPKTDYDGRRRHNTPAVGACD